MESAPQEETVGSLGDREETANCLATRTVSRNIPDTEGNQAQIAATTRETKPKTHKTKPKRKTQKTMLTETQTGNKEVIEYRGGAGC